jgi:hypothetical protein
MGVSGQLEALAIFILREEPPVPLSQDQWAPKTVSAF